MSILSLEERVERLEKQSYFWCTKHNKVKDRTIVKDHWFGSKWRKPKLVCESCKKIYYSCNL